MPQHPMAEGRPADHQPGALAVGKVLIHGPKQRLIYDTSTHSDEGQALAIMRLPPNAESAREVSRWVFGGRARTLSSRPGGPSTGSGQTSASFGRASRMPYCALDRAWLDLERALNSAVGDIGRCL
jgi:hypothetical protein